jgi:NADH dehydrogenase FAD-containing subunit
MRLVIIGAGFAGMYAALSAARLRDIQGARPDELEIALVAPEPTLVVRPRLYEPRNAHRAAARSARSHRRRLCARQRRDDRHRISHGADRHGERHAKDAAL